MTAPATAPEPATVMATASAPAVVSMAADLASNGSQKWICGGLTVTITTEEIARLASRRYGRRSGNPHGVSMDDARCVEEVWSGDEWIAKQCRRKRGYGLGGLFCRQHAKSRKDISGQEPATHTHDVQSASHGAIEILDALVTLDLSSGVLIQRIRRDVESGSWDDAQKQLQFLDRLIEQWKRK